MASAGNYNIASRTPGQMRWYGWGNGGSGFDPTGRPNLIPYAVATLGVDPDHPPWVPPDPSTVIIPAITLSDAQRQALNDALPGTDKLSFAHYDRLLHAYGRGTRDVWRLRHGWVDWAPDAVAFPETEADVVKLIGVAAQLGIAVVPFGGGSNVVGCLEAVQGSVAPTLTMNMRRMNRLLSLDETSGLARVEAGILGPDLESALGEHGFTFGHLPDSFMHSTVGGWVATRSSGMLSDGYGNPEDRVAAVRLVTPVGMVVTKALPHSSAGPDVNRIVAGSEGALGILTEVTLSVRRVPQQRSARALLFRDFDSGVAALREARTAGLQPVASRLNDPMKTRLSVAFRRVSGRSRFVAPLLKTMMRKLHRLDFDTVNLMVNVYEGSPRAVLRQQRTLEALYRRHGAVSVGAGPANAIMESKFDLPHVRDYLFDRRVITDVAETSVPWAAVSDLYRSGRDVLMRALTRGGRRAWVGAHVSHTYPMGCSLYFTFAFHCLIDQHGQYDPARELAHYLGAKENILNHFCAAGGAVSHHHAVGQEHLPWLKQEAAFADGSLIEALKASVDPTGIMNPGRHATSAARPLSTVLSPVRNREGSDHAKVTTPSGEVTRAQFSEDEPA